MWLDICVTNLKLLPDKDRRGYLKMLCFKSYNIGYNVISLERCISITRVLDYFQKK